jgi:hypothetical protein
VENHNAAVSVSDPAQQLGYPSIFEALTHLLRMSHKITTRKKKQASGYFLLISLYCFINGVSLTALSLDANLFYI